MSENETPAGPSRFSQPMRSPWAPAVAVAAIVAALFLTRTGAAQSAPAASLDIHTTGTGVQVDTPQITVSGVGEVKGTPDTLTVNIDVSSAAAHASDALRANNNHTAALIASLTGHGVAPSDIQTGNLSIQPTYNSYPQITGYQVDEAVTVTLHDLAKAGAIVDSAAQQAGDSVRIQGMSLSINDTSDLMANARRQAVENAKTKAQQLAAGAGTTLGSVRTITENTSYVPTMLGMVPSADSAAKAIPVQPGTQQLSVTVTVVYQLG